MTRKLKLMQGKTSNGKKTWNKKARVHLQRIFPVIQAQRVILQTPKTNKMVEKMVINMGGVTKLDNC